MNTLYGMLLTKDGATMKRSFSNDPRHFLAPIRRTFWTTRSADARRVQASWIPVRASHGQPPIGEVIHLERRQIDGTLWAVAHIADGIEPAPGCDWYWSVEATWNERDGSDVEIRGAALCAKSAQIGLRPLTLLHGALDYRAAPGRWTLDRWPKELLTRAADTHYHRRAHDPLHVYDPPGEPQRIGADAWLVDDELVTRHNGNDYARPPGKLWHSVPRKGSVLRVS